jgi:hypothetical protein
MKNLKRALRRHQATTHMNRRLSEDRNQHRHDLDHQHPVLVNDEGSYCHINNEFYKDDPNWYLGLSFICPCFYDPRAKARFKEQPKFQCHPLGCGNMRSYDGPTLQEIKAETSFKEELDEYFVRDDI